MMMNPVSWCYDWRQAQPELVVISIRCWTEKISVTSEAQYENCIIL